MCRPGRARRTTTERGQEREAESTEALKGKRVGIARGTGSQTFWPSVLKKLKLNPADHTAVNVKAPERASALERGNIDAFAVWELWPLRAIPGIRILLNNKAIQIVRTYAYVNRGWAEASRDTTSRLQRALVEATAFIEGNREEAARQVARFLRQDRGLVAELMGKVGYRINLTAHSVADVRLAIDQLRGMHRLAQEVAPAQAIWQDALRAAAPERVKI